mgnify:CR=1 FL=1
MNESELEEIIDKVLLSTPGAEELIVEVKQRLLKAISLTNETAQRLETLCENLDNIEMTSEDREWLNDLPKGKELM